LSRAHARNVTSRFESVYAAEKGVDRAIEVARTIGVPLKIAAKVDRVDEDYFREQIAPLLKGPGVEFIGEIDERQKADFLGQAFALMFLIDWPEPFGLAMIEAMAWGTPVLALRRGSVEEVVEDGVTGHIVDSIEQATVSAPRLMMLDRRAVRRRFEERFTAARMAKDYVQVYNSVIRANAKLVPDQAALLHATAAELANEPSESVH
jgi:glycosyltransferase involved in cell wall biosynthesis